MTSLEENFLNQFDSGVSPHVIEFGKRLMSVNADAFLLTARKAVCFVGCLESLKLTALSGIITSDRVLDMDLARPRGKKVAVVDDALISVVACPKLGKE